MSKLFKAEEKFTLILQQNSENKIGLFANTNRQIIWIGHSTVLLQIDGLNILTDPHFGNAASPVSWAGPKRITQAALPIEQLPRIDIVLISHDHYDHLDLESIKYLELKARQANYKTQFFVPLGLKTWFLDQNIENVTELDWWNSVNFLDWHIEAVPLQHDSGRGLFDHNKSLWAGWVLKNNNFKFFFAGDTGYSEDFKIIGQKHGPFDLAALPIGGYAPRELFSGVHVSPNEAVQIHIDIRAKKSIGIHWGTFLITDEPVNDPPRELAESLRQKKLEPQSFEVLSPGAVLKLK